MLDAVDNLVIIAGEKATRIALNCHVRRILPSIVSKQVNQKFIGRDRRRLCQDTDA